MKDKDKLFLLSYLNISTIASTDIPQFLDKFSRAIKFDDSVQHIIIPVRDGETRVECINPVLLTEEQYKEAEEKIKNLQNEVEEAIKKLKNG